MAAATRSSTQLLLVTLAVLVAAASASIYPIESSFWVPPFQRAEKMFATDHGPVFAHSGNSTVSVRSFDLVSECLCW